MQQISKLKESVQKKVIRKIICSLGHLSDRDLVNMLRILQRLSPQNKEYIRNVQESVEKNHPTKKLIRKILEDTDLHCRDKLIENLIIQGILLKTAIRDKIFNDKGYSLYTILISPTMRCNLKCIGCYASAYTRKDDLDAKTFDRIIEEGEKEGVAFFTILGGEPLIYKDLFKIFETHNNSYFQFYTNGTLINDKTVKKILKLGNVLPIISVEGFKKRTDERRGRGVYESAVRAMDILRKNKVPFGFSAVVSRKNAEEVTSDDFIDFMIEKGAYLGWFFLYMPVGKNPDLSLMPTPEQRRTMLERDEFIRSNKPLFIIDFWNDAPYVGGCIAANKYIHINHNGDVEPCIFTHFAMDNIKDKSLNDVMNSEYFKEIRKRQPYNKNLYLPCMWVDNPEISREFKERLKIYPTHTGADDVLVKKSLKAGINEYSKKVKSIYKPIWEKTYKKFDFFKGSAR